MHNDAVNSVCFKPNSGVFATGSQDKIIRLWNVQNSNIVSWVDSTKIITAVEFSTDGERLVRMIFNNLSRYEEPTKESV
jgi:WD40 repeat protein